MPIPLRIAIRAGQTAQHTNASAAVRSQKRRHVRPARVLPLHPPSITPACTWRCARRFPRAAPASARSPDEILVATGSRPNTAGLGLGRAGVELDSRGAIVVDCHQQTSAPSIYAAGDVTNQPQLVCVAAAGGAAAAQNGLAGAEEQLDLDSLPRVTFTTPQIANTRGLYKLVAETGTRAMTVQEFSSIWAPYLTMAEGLKLAARAFSRDVAKLSCCA